MRRILFIIFILISPTIAEARKGITYSYKGKKVISRPNTVYSDSSEYLRENNDFYLSASAGLIAYSFNAGYFINPDSLLQTSYVKQSDTVIGDSEMYALGGTRFVGNSLYLTGQVAFRKGDTIDYKNSIIDAEEILHSTDYGIDLAIGNRWNWENFILGGEWFAIYIPLIGKEIKTFEMQFRVLMVHVGLIW